MAGSISAQRMVQGVLRSILPAENEKESGFDVRKE